MKKYILLASLLFVSGSVFSQNLLSVSNLSVERKGDLVEVSFDATNATRSLKINNTYTFTPSITNGNDKLAIPSIVFGSKRAKILNKRRGVSVAQFNHKGDTVHYRLNVPYHEWMTDGALVMETSVTGCCNRENMSPYFIASNILPKPVEVPEVAPIVSVDPVVVASSGRQMEQMYSFVVPESELSSADVPLLDFTIPLAKGKALNQTDQRMIDNYLSQHDEGALEIFFKRSQVALDTTFKENSESMQKLIVAVNAIVNSPDSKVTHVVIAGFASPEGSLDSNERLAWRRVESIKKFLVANVKVDAWQIHMYNGGENWAGLREMVAANNMKYKDQVLAIIDNVPIHQGREKQLMDLCLGDPYRYMMEHYFPQLRSAAYIRIYYQDVERAKN